MVIPPNDWKCSFCRKHIHRLRSRSQKYCSKECLNQIQKITFLGHGNPFYGKKHTKELKEKLSLRNRMRIGDRGFRWIKDRNKIIGPQNRNNPLYKQWRYEIWLRDNFKCKIGNPDCCGRIEAHHILPWKDFPELRYEINNGITLCHFHHPRKREEEKRLSPYFQRLVSQIDNKDGGTD